MTGELTNHLWQSTLFAAAAGLLTIAFRENRAQVRYWLWLSASCKFLVPFVFLLNLGSQFDWTPAAEQASPPAVSLAMQQIAEPFSYVSDAGVSAVARTSRDWVGITIFGVWACGFVVIALLRLRSWRQIQAAIRGSTRVDISSAVEVRSSRELIEPGVVGWWNPVLLLPAGITDRLTRLQLNAVLAHELCHVRRRDNFTAAIHMIVECVFWFHPLVWWIGGRLIEERERACDEEVLQLGNQPEVYAEGILNVCKSYLESPLRCVSGVTGSDLKTRIQTILSGHVAGDLSSARKAALAIAGIAAVAAPFAVGVMNAPVLRGQSTEKLMFEVASVKRSPPVMGNRVFFGPPRGGPGTPDPGQITWTYVRMKSLITTAYDVKEYQVSGPAWLDTERYDVAVKVPAGAKKEQVRVMWQNLLAERFGVQMHLDSKEFRVQELVIAKGGSKLKESVEDPGAPIPEGPPKIENGELKSAGQITRIMRDEKGARAQTTAKAQPLSQLTQMLSNQLSMPVVDKTGLTGKYDYDLEFVPDIRGMGMPPPPPGAPGPGPGAGASEPETDVASAIQQQLGLRLVASKAQLNVVVIDKAEKVPTDN